MNQEYILLGGFIWKILRKKIYFWRNHQYGNLLTRMAVWLSNKVFCTSKYSYMAKFKKTEIMPVGIDTNKFSIFNFQFSNRKNKILFLSRMSPIKRPDLLIKALNILNKKGTDFVCNFYGDPLSKDESFYTSLKNKVKELNLGDKINFYKSMPNSETPKIYNEHEIFVNLTPTGSFDKTIIEAAACGCILVVANKSLSGEIDQRMVMENEKPETIAERINFWLNMSDEERAVVSDKLRQYVLKNHSLSALINDIVLAMDHKNLK